MVKKANEPDLKEALETHRKETEGQVERLEKVFKLLDVPARGKKCEAIEGIISEAKEHMEEIENEKVLDAGMISSAQAVEHYEICRYGTLIEWAKDLGHDGVRLACSSRTSRRRRTPTNCCRRSRARRPTRRQWQQSDGLKCKQLHDVPRGAVCETSPNAKADTAYALMSRRRSKASFGGTLERESLSKPRNRAGCTLQPRPGLWGNPMQSEAILLWA